MVLKEKRFSVMLHRKYSIKKFKGIFRKIIVSFYSVGLHGL